MVRFICSALLLVLLVSCTQAPQPLRHSRTGVDTTGLRLRDGGTVYIEPIQGPAKPLAETMANELAKAMNDMNITATPNRITNPTYRVKGQVALDRGDKSPRLDTTIYWRFFDRNETMIHESSQAISIERTRWQYGDQAMIEQITENAAETFAGYLQDKRLKEAVQNPNDDQTIISMGTIQGARGDGEFALNKAMRHTFSQAGAVISPTLRKNGYQIDGDIDILEPFEGKQRIKLSWIVRDDQGNELGRAQQNNQMNAGRFDERWGNLAYLIAKAALPSIGAIIERDQSQKRFERSREDQPKTNLPGKRQRLVIPPF